MKCGEAVIVKDFWGAYRLRCIAMCEGRFMLISNQTDMLNGYLLAGWQAAMRELVALTVPAKLLEKTCHAESTTGGQYQHVPLTYPLSAKGLAGLFGVPDAEVAALLEDWAVRWHEV